jgi:hypothetical protein
MMLLGIGSGYFLWGSRVARLTESINALTLELDTMRERLARPQADEMPGGVRAADELRVINESIAAVRTELSEQKAMIERNALAATPVDAAEAQAHLRKLREELAVCIADKQDFEIRCGGNKPPAPPAYVTPPEAPMYRPTPSPAPGSQPATPSSRPPVGNDLDDPRF